MMDRTFIERSLGLLYPKDLRFLLEDHIMLTESMVLDYIKANLGHPVMQIELNDDQILEYVKKFTLPYFSKSKPLELYTLVNLEEHPELKVNETTFKLPPNYEHKLIGIIDVIPPMNAYFINNWPYNPLPSWNTLPEHLLFMTKSLTQTKYSMYNFTWKYFYPDKIQILPKLNMSYWLVHGAFTHSFETIPTDWERAFLDLALADIYDYIASLRVKFQNYTTPYGDINLNWDYFQNRANEIRQRVLESLKKTRLLKYCYVR